MMLTAFDSLAAQHKTTELSRKPLSQVYPKSLVIRLNLFKSHPSLLNFVL